MAESKTRAGKKGTSKKASGTAVPARPSVPPPRADARTKSTPAGREGAKAATKAAPKTAPKAAPKAAVRAASGATSSGATKASRKPRDGAARPASKPVAPPDPIERRRIAARRLALALAHVGLEKKAERIEIVDVTEKVDYADFLVLMSGRSDRQVVAVAQAVEEAAEKDLSKKIRVEGVPQGHWVLIDAGDVVVHVFLEEARGYYDLEGLWLDAPRVKEAGVTTDGKALLRSSFS